MAHLLSHATLLPNCTAASRPAVRPLTAALPNVLGRRPRQHPSWSQQRAPVCCAQEPASQPAAPPPQSSSDEFEGLTPEEDTTVPGSYEDAINGNTRLGKAVRAACTELDHLNTMEQDVLNQADSLLKKLGVKVPGLSIKPPPKGQAVDDEEEEEEQEEEQAAAPKA